MSTERPAPPAADRFPALVELACHDLRTPLATVSGLAKTLRQAEAPRPTDAHFVELIDEAADQMAVLLDQLGLAARIASGRYDPATAEADTLSLAASAGDDRVRAEGHGAVVETDPVTAARALAALAAAALRFGELPAVTGQVDGRELTQGPLPADAAAR